ncbi:unnamed protein product, partial [Vitis vinifera]
MELKSIAMHMEQTHPTNQAGEEVCGRNERSDPSLLHRVKHRTGKRPVMWPYVPYDEIPHPYAPGVYDRKAPPGYVRNPSQDPQVSNLARASSTEVKYTTAFSDDNPNACIIM